MDTLDAVTLKAFLAALMRLEDSLSTDLQNQLNEIGKTFPRDIAKLHTLVKDYSPLKQEYMDARVAMQVSETRIGSQQDECPVENGDEKLINFAVEVLKATDSVNLVHKAYTESTELGAILFKLRLSTSFMVKDAQNIPQEELWVWMSPTAWAELERGLRQAQAGLGRYLGDFSQYADLETED
jgi:hypothetical protein